MEKENNNNNINLLKIIRCPECSLIPLINFDINEETNIYNIQLKCENNHKLTIPLNEDTMIQNLFNKKNKQCSNCLDSKVKIYYCKDCFKFFCLKCKEIHIKNQKHVLISTKKKDNYCFEHKQINVGYCKTHEKNICYYCKHDECNVEYNIKYSENDIKNYENNLKYVKDILNTNKNNFNLFIENLKDLIKNFEKKFNLNLMNYQKIVDIQKNLLNTFFKMNNKKLLNYQILKNLENINLNFQEVENLKYKQIKKIKKEIQNFFAENEEENITIEIQEPANSSEELSAEDETTKNSKKDLLNDKDFISKKRDSNFSSSILSSNEEIINLIEDNNIYINLPKLTKNNKTSSLFCFYKNLDVDYKEIIKKVSSYKNEDLDKIKIGKKDNNILLLLKYKKSITLNNSLVKKYFRIISKDEKIIPEIYSVRYKNKDIDNYFSDCNNIKIYQYKR